MGKEDIELNERTLHVYVLRLAAAPLFGDRLSSFLQTLLPGLDWDMAARTGLAEAVADVAVNETDAFLVFRDDLPAGEGVRRPWWTASAPRRATK